MSWFIVYFAKHTETTNSRPNLKDHNASHSHRQAKISYENINLGKTDDFDSKIIFSGYLSVIFK